jgi:hypothetical protein
VKDPVAPPPLKRSRHVSPAQAASSVAAFDEVTIKSDPNVEAAGFEDDDLYCETFEDMSGEGESSDFVEMAADEGRPSDDRPGACLSYQKLKLVVIISTPFKYL